MDDVEHVRGAQTLMADAHSGDETVIIAGHSHGVAFGMPWAAESESGFSLEPLNAPNFLCLTGTWPRTPAYWDALVAAAEHKKIGLIYNGNQHTAMFFLAQKPEVDIILPGREGDLVDVNKTILPVKLVKEEFNYSFGELHSVIRSLLATEGCTPFLIGTPPPRGDDETLKLLFDTKHPFLSDVASHLQVGMEDSRLCPAQLRYKAWVLLQECMKELADSYGIQFIPAVPEAGDEQGYLRPEFYWDFSHASPAYGTLMLQHIRQELNRPHHPALPTGREAKTHPYSDAPARAFWSRAVSRSFNPASMVATYGPLVKLGDKVVSAGSCFASNLVPYLTKSGLTYHVTEKRHVVFSSAPLENLGYEKFSASYGNIYTVRQMLQLVMRSMGEFQPVEDRWATEDGIVDPFRPGLKYNATSHREFDSLTRSHLAACRAAFVEADVLIFTLGLTEAWISKVDGAVFPACPGTVGGKFDPTRHEFKNFTAQEVSSDLRKLIAALKKINPKIRLILTVSPVPLVATATQNHVLSASVYSKSVLRVAAEENANLFQEVFYFPAYEIVTGPQAPKNFFEDDKRNVSVAAVDVVMAAFLALCETRGEGAPVAPAAPPEQIAKEELLQKIGAQFVSAECEEMMVEKR
jgi:GSCFA family